METLPLVYLGIDPSQRYQPYVYAALDQSLKIIALGSGPLREVLAYSAGLSSAVIAINAPQGTNKGLLEEANRGQKLFPLDLLKEENMRLVEASLLQEGIRIVRTPALEDDCMMWVKRGFKLYNKLRNLGYSQFLQQGERLYCESVSEAVFSRLMGGVPLFDEDTLEGRLQRQLILFEHKLPIKDAMEFFEEVTRFRLLHGVLPMEDIYSSGELNALACAFTAWMLAQQPEKTESLGEEMEGIVYLPVKNEEQKMGIFADKLI